MTKSLIQITSVVDYLMSTIAPSGSTYQSPVVIPRVPGHNVLRPVNTLEELKQLEESLRSKDTMDRYIVGMAHVCGDSGTSSGTDCCYKLIDYFITRSLMQNCSWTGAAWKGGQHTTGEKIPLRQFPQFRTLLRKLVQLADWEFTEVQCDMFFRQVCKNSKQRAAACRGILSTTKKRPNNLKYRKRKVERSAETQQPSGGIKDEA